MSTYGFDDSKSKKQVYRADEVYNKTEVYSKTETYNKTETYSKTEADSKFMTQTAGAPKNHASTSSQYGVGTSTNYGHVKLTTSTSAPSGSQDGIALAGSMGYMLKKYTDDAIAAAIASQQIPVGFGVLVKNESDINKLGYGSWLNRGQVGATGSGGIIYRVYLFTRES